MKKLIGIISIITIVFVSSYSISLSYVESPVQAPSGFVWVSSNGGDFENGRLISATSTGQDENRVITVTCDTCEDQCCWEITNNGGTLIIHYLLKPSKPNATGNPVSDIYLEPIE